MKTTSLQFKKTSLRRLSLLGLSSVALLASSHVQAVGLVNGGFETDGTTLDPAGNPGYVNVGTSAMGAKITGWATTLGSGGTGAGFYYNRTGSQATWIPNSQEGSYAVQLDSTNSGSFTVGDSLSQTFTLNPGTYQVSFALNNETGAAAATSGALVSLSGAATGSFSNLSFTVSRPAGSSTQAWTIKTTPSFTVTSAATNLTLTFQDDAAVTMNSNIALDNIRIVPEPSSVALLAAGSLVLCGFVRRVRG